MENFRNIEKFIAPLSATITRPLGKAVFSSIEQPMVILTFRPGVALANSWKMGRNFSVIFCISLICTATFSNALTASNVKNENVVTAMKRIEDVKFNFTYH